MEEHGTSVATPLVRPENQTSQSKPAASVPPAPRRSRTWVVIGIVLALGGTAGAYYFLDKDHGKPTPSGEGHADEHHSTAGAGLPVEAVHPRQGGIERKTTQAGSVHSFEYAELFAKVSGYLKVQNVDIGDRVKVGQLLAVIEDPEVDKAVDQNKAALDQAVAMVKVADAKVRSAQAAKEAAEAMVKQAETMIVAKVSNQELQDKQLKRIHGLVVRGAVEDKLEDEQKDRFDVAKADVGVAQAEVLSSKAVVMNKEALIEEAQADLIEAKANVEVAQANLGKALEIQKYTRITSPYEGVITVRNFHRGDFIRSASEGGTSRCWPSPRPTRCASSCRSPTPTCRSSTRGTRPRSSSSPCPAGPSTASSRGIPGPRTRRAGTCGPRLTCPTPTARFARECTGGSR